MKHGIRTRLALACALLLGAAGAAQSATLVTDWNDQALQAVRATRMAPPIFARTNAIVNTAMYDAWAAYDSKANGTQLGGELRRPAAERTDANRRKAMSFAAYRTLVELFPTRTAQFAAEMARLGYDPADTSGNLATPQGVGNVAAYSDYTGYVPVNSPTQIIDPTRWQPLSVPNGSGGFNTQSFLVPHWGNVKGFGLARYDQFAIKPPAPLGSFEFWRQSVEVLTYSATLTDRTKTIAEWWADGPGSETPPGTWMLFAKQVSDRKHHTLGQDVRMHFALSNAMFDAGIAVWGYKRQYDYARPVTTIHSLFNNRPIVAWGGEGQGTKVILGQHWRPYQVATFITPPFSEHVSGHSTFSSSAAETLKLFTGIVPAQPVTLSWPTFSAAADEAGISRLYGGIHFRNGDLEGRKLGRKVGAQAYALSRAYINGTAGN
jgi:PAP2 superfamily